MSVETLMDVEKLKVIGRIVANVLVHMKTAARPGMTTAELDAIGARELDRLGARSAPKTVYDFPGATCISVNEEAAHGVPGVRILKDGDLINVDVSAEKDGYFADTGGSFILGKASARKIKVCRAAREALGAAILEARDGARLSDIGRAMEGTAHRFGLTTLRNLGSHGVGRSLHEEPKFIPGFHDPKEKRRLKAGQVITLEPFVSDGALWADETDDGWTLANPGHLTAQYEHTLIITDGIPVILTLPDQDAFF